MKTPNDLKTLYVCFVHSLYVALFFFTEAIYFGDDDDD